MYAFSQMEIDRGLGFALAKKIVLLCTCIRLASILNCSDPAFGGAQNRRDRSLLTIVSESDSHCRLKVRQLPTKVVARRKNMVGVNEGDEAHTETIIRGTIYRPAREFHSTRPTGAVSSCSLTSAGKKGATGTARLSCCRTGKRAVNSSTAR